MAVRDFDLYPSFKRIIEEKALLPSGEAAVAAGFSGGADSVALLDLLYRLRAERPSLYVAAHHQQHRIRQVSAEEDLAFCRAFCAARDIELFVSDDDVPALAAELKIGLEEAGRLCRYRNWEKLVRELGERWPEVRLATAHHADDQAETLLLRLERGTGLRGLGGIAARRDFYIRPLLEFSRAELEAYLIWRKLEWREDETNLDDRYRRNFLRLRVLPLWQEAADPGLGKRLAKTAGLLAESELYLETEARKAAELLACYPAEPFLDPLLCYYDCEQFRKLDPALRVPALKRCAEKVTGLKDFGSAHFADMAALLETRAGEKTLRLPGGHFFRTNGKVFYFHRNSYEITCPLPLAEKDFEETLFPPAERGSVSLNAGGWRLFTFRDELPGPGDVVYKYEETRSFTVRTPKPGDFVVTASGMRKALRRFFSEQGVPRALRQRICLFCRGSEVISAGPWHLGNDFHYKSVKIVYNKGKIAECFRLVWYNSRNK